MMIIAECFHKLTELNLSKLDNDEGHNPLGDDGLLILASRPKQLTRLSLKGCRSGPRGLIAVVNTFRKLTDLGIGKLSMQRRRQ